MALMLDKYSKEKLHMEQNIEQIKQLITNLETNEDYRINLLTRQKELEIDVQNLINNEYPIAVLANWNAGKSTFLNALIGNKILPMRNKSYTSEITRIRYSDDPKIIIHYTDGETEQIPLTDDLEEDFLVKYVTVDGADSNKGKVEEVIVEYPLEICKEGVVLVDTPGVHGIHASHDKVTYKVIPNAKAIIMLVTADSPGGIEEVNFLKRILTGRDKNDYDILFVINKADSITKDDLTDAIDSLETAISEVTDEDGQQLIEEPTIIPVSSYTELNYQLYQNDLIGFDSLSNDTKLYYKNKRGRRKTIENVEDVQYLQEISNFIPLRHKLNDAFMELDTTKRLLASIKTGMYSLCSDDILRYLQRNIQSLKNDKSMEQLEAEAASVQRILQEAEQAKGKIVADFEKEMDEFCDDYVSHVQDDWRNKVISDLNKYIDSLSLSRLENDGQNLISNEFKRLIQREYYQTSKRVSTHVEKIIAAHVGNYQQLIKQTDSYFENLDEHTFKLDVNENINVSSIGSSTTLVLNKTNRLMITSGLAMAGAHVGALLGSVVPIIGNIIGGILGGIIGGLLGWLGLGPNEAKIKRDMKSKINPELTQQCNKAYQEQRTAMIEMIENTKNSGIDMFNSEFADYRLMIESSYKEIMNNMQLKADESQKKLDNMYANMKDTMAIMHSIQETDAITVTTSPVTTN